MNGIAEVRLPNGFKESFGNRIAPSLFEMDKNWIKKSNLEFYVEVILSAIKYQLGSGFVPIIGQKACC